MGNNNTLKIQNIINSCEKDGVAIIPSGVYILEDTVTVRSDITVKGEGETVLMAGENFNGKDSPLMNTKNACNLTIENIVFDGRRADEHKGGLLALSLGKNITVRCCVFKNSIRIALSIGAEKDIFIEKCTFENNGYDMPSKISSPALWTDRIGEMHPQNINVIECTFRNNNWSGCYFMPNGGKIARCRFIDNGESSIFTSSHGRNIIYEDNYIVGAKMSNISASGIEIGASDVIVRGNFIKNCGDAGISLTNLKNVLIEDNLILNNSRETGKTEIYFYSLGDFFEGEYTPDNIVIENNIVANILPNRSAQCACIGFWRRDDGFPMTNIKIKNNRFDAKEREKVFFTLGEKKGTFADEDFYTVAFEENEKGCEITAETEKIFIDALEKRISCDK